jgi:hypothetical protein
MPTGRAMKQSRAEALLDRANVLCDHCCRYTISLSGSGKTSAFDDFNEHSHAGQLVHD